MGEIAIIILSLSRNTQRKAFSLSKTQEPYYHTYLCTHIAVRARDVRMSIASTAFASPRLSVKRTVASKFYTEYIIFTSRWIQSPTGNT